jgi:hypothetical protein
MTKKKAARQQDQQPSHFKPEYSDVFNFVESEKFSFRSISTTAFENNILCAGVKSKLRGLDMGGPEQFVFAQHLTVHMLRKVASKLGLTSHNVAKPVIAEMIINKVGELEEKVAKAKENGEDIDVSTIALVDEKGRAVAINTPRFLNVLFSEKIIPLLANRGANLSKDDLENRTKVDQELFAAVITEYNDNSNVSYGLHAFNNIPQKVDPSIFTKIPTTAWKHVRDKFKNIVKEYEHHIKAWTRSGNHGRFDELSANDLKAIDPDINKCTSKYMIYMHYFMRQHHNILATCVALLPNDVARRSTQAKTSSGSNYGRSGKETSGEKEGSKHVGKSRGMQVALNSIAKKNNAHQRKIEVDIKNSEKQTAMSTSLALSRQIEEEKQSKRRMEQELQTNCSNDRRAMNEKVRAVKAKIESKGSPQSEIENDDDDDDGDFFDLEPLSQEDLIIQILHSTEKIKTWEKCYRAAEDDLKKSFLASDKENGTENV